MKPIFAIHAVAVLTLWTMTAIPAFAQMGAPPDPQMKAVLDATASLKPKPIEKLSPAEARKQPLPGDGVKLILKRRNGGTLPPPEAVAKVENRTVPGPAGSLPVRVYTPEGDGPFPVLVYYHGGGWVIASIEAYDSSPRALANAAKCVVVSVGYRYAPENKFPAQHMDALTAFQYIQKNAAQFGGDPDKVAIGGESAGGNMAASVSLMLRDKKQKLPIHQLLVYPIADTNTNRPSYKENYAAKPLNTPMVKWFAKHTLEDKADAKSRYLAVVRHPNLRNLPPATIVAAQIDPLASEGKAYADKLRAAGVPVRYKMWTGVTHEFFGMGAVVDKAKEAVAFAAAGLRSSFDK